SGIPREAGASERGRIRCENGALAAANGELGTQGAPAVPLSAGESRLLVAFIEHPKISLTRDQLLDLTQGRTADPFDRSIDNAVSRLRRKIEEDPKNPRLIKTVWAGGYVFTGDPVAA